ncbi:MAG: DNA translocase FtsK [Armatimonadota bacterium]|nr:DNA translocase FtsK [Armatimonadota bacterium]MDR7535276.1 DNA translocase FtsK [Armatimonadota bacterium]
MSVARRRRTSPNRAAAAGLTLAVLALLLALSFLPDAAGVPAVLARWQRVLLGRAAPLLPASCGAAGLVLLAAGARVRMTRRIGGLCLGTVASLLILHLRTTSGDVLAAGLRGQGAGVVGGALAWALERVLGPTGRWVAIGAFAVVAGALLAGLTLTAVGAALVATARAARHGAVAAAWVALTVARRAGRVAIRGTGTLIRTATQTAPRVTRVLAALAAETGRMLARGRLTLAGPVAAARSGPDGPEAPAPAGTLPPVSASPPPAIDDGSPRPPAHTAGLVEAAGDEGTAERPAGTGARRRRRPEVVDVQQERLEFAAVEYRLPPLSLLGDPATATRGRVRVDPAETARALENTLASFGVEAKVVHWEVGPVVTRFEVQPAPGVKVQKITSLTNDIALNLAAQSVRIEAPIPGKSAVGIEIPNQKASLVHLREILHTDLFQKATSPLVVGIGKDIAGGAIVADLAEMPHLLIAGATGSGKSVMLNAMIASLLFRSTPHQVRLVMIDPKRVELTDYNEIPHLLAPVVTNPRQAASVLKDMLRIMEQRFERFAEVGARNIQAYNQRTDVAPMYYIVIIIDELADLMMVAPADFEDIICRLAQMTRATGIHLVVATQRPSVDVITGLIKANIPSRLAFAVSSQVDSRTILDTTGAEKLLGRGDMLFLPLGASRPIRAQGAYIADAEIRAVVDWWRQQARPVYDQQLVAAQRTAGAEDGIDGERLIEAARLVVRTGYGSVSLLQRKMRIGYVTAARLIDELEARGIVGPVQGSNPREVLIGLDELERLLRARSTTAADQ